MSISISSLTSSAATTAYQAVAKASKSTTESTTSSTDKYGEAAVYEKSSSVTDRDSIIAQLKADSEAQTQNLMNLVQKTIAGQGNALSKTDDMWSYLASGNFTVDAATKAQAQADIAEDGYWGVNQTSDRILEFAKALSGNDTSKAEELINAFKKGFSEATKTWGKDLPSISQDTYDAVLQKFDQWVNGTEE